MKTGDGLDVGIEPSEVGRLMEKTQRGKDNLIREEVIGLLGEMYFTGLGCIQVRFCRDHYVGGCLPGAGGGVTAGCSSGSCHHAAG